MSNNFVDDGALDTPVAPVAEPVAEVAPEVVAEPAPEVAPEVVAEPSVEVAPEEVK
jgi:hypothetical protein